MKSILSFLIAVVLFLRDEDILGLRIEETVKAIAKPFVFAYVCGSYVAEFPAVQMLYA